MYLSMTAISILIVLIGVLIAYFTYKRIGIKDLIKTTRENTEMLTKLDYVVQGVNIIQNKIENQDSKIGSFNERLIVVEILSKQNEKSINDIDYIKRREIV